MTHLLAAALPLLLAAATAAPLSFNARVDGERAMEKARYAFVIGATKPFDEVYPRSVFERKVRRQQLEERLLGETYAMHVTTELLAREYDRVEKETKAPEQWEAMKKALGSRRMAEEIVCRPLLVDRALRARFAFDRQIHAAEHEKARAARNELLAGRTPAETKTLRLSRRAEGGASTDQLLKQARAEAEGPKVLSSPGEPAATEAPVPVDPEMAAVLERQLAKKGDVTTILEERDRFSVFRLVASQPDEWLVEAVQVPKRDFEGWLARPENGAKGARTKPGVP